MMKAAPLVFVVVVICLQRAWSLENITRPLEAVDRQGADDVLPDGAGAGRWEKRSSFLRGRIYHSAVWNYGEMIVWGGGSEHYFHDDGGIYDAHKDEWRPVSKVGAPSGRWGHAAVWTDKEMIVWGGRSSFASSENKNDGAIYDPRTDTWRPMSTDGAPSPRSQMAAAWMGRQMIVWGGWGDGGTCPASGGIYDLQTDRWTKLSMENAPVGRLEPAFVWTGRELIVWGGLLEDGRHSASTGGRYDPELREWKTLSADGAPASVRGAQAVWTGKEMIVWGGSHLDGDSLVNIGSNAGGRYDPVTDSWRPIALEGAPEGRMYYGVVWTGSEMIVWSGGDQRRGNVITGGRYDPATDAWIATANMGAPAGRGLMTALWTGAGMLIYGGSTGGVEAFNDTSYYLPAE